MEIVKDVRVLKAMARQGFINLDEKTGKTVYHRGYPRKAYYVDDLGANSSNGEFLYKGYRYTTKYFDGCFLPFVIQLEPDEDLIEVKYNQRLVCV